MLAKENKPRLTSTILLLLTTGNHRALGKTYSPPRPHEPVSTCRFFFIYAFFFFRGTRRIAVGRNASSRENVRVRKKKKIRRWIAKHARALLMNFPSAVSRVLSVIQRRIVVVVLSSFSAYAYFKDNELRDLFKPHSKTRQQKLREFSYHILTAYTGGRFRVL